MVGTHSLTLTPVPQGKDASLEPRGKSSQSANFVNPGTLLLPVVSKRPQRYIEAYLSPVFEAVRYHLRRTVNPDGCPLDLMFLDTLAMGIGRHPAKTQAGAAALPVAIGLILVSNLYRCYRA